MGSSNSVHSEQINNSINFLYQQGIPRKILDSYSLCHYGDGTTNGRGENRYTLE